MTASFPLFLPLLSLSLTLFALLSSFPLVYGHGGPRKNSYKPTSGEAAHFVAEWVTYEVDEVLWGNFSVQVHNNGWLAIGFTAPNESAGYDIIAGHVNKTYDRYLSEQISDLVLGDDDVELGGTYDILFSSFLYDPNEQAVKMTFSRKLNTNDTYDYNLEQKGLLKILWAYGNMNGDNFGPVVHTGIDTIAFINEEMEKDEGQQLKAHGIMMMLVVLVLMPSGMIFSRYLKIIFPWWFYAHTAIFCLTVFFVAVAAIIIFKAHDNMFVAGWHAVFGLIFIIGMGLQTILGLVSHFRFDPKRTAPPVFPDKIHWYTGRAMFLLGFVTVLLGLYVLPARKFAKNSFWAWIVLIFFFVLTLERHIGQTHEVPVKGIAQDDEAFMADLDTEEEIVAETRAKPKRGNIISHGVVPRQISPKTLFKILCPFGFAILLLFILISVAINTTEL